MFSEFIAETQLEEPLATGTTSGLTGSSLSTVDPTKRARQCRLGRTSNRPVRAKRFPSTSFPSPSTDPPVLAAFPALPLSVAAGALDKTTVSSIRESTQHGDALASQYAIGRVQPARQLHSERASGRRQEDVVAGHSSYWLVTTDGCRLRPGQLGAGRCWPPSTARSAVAGPARFVVVR